MAEAEKKKRYQQAVMGLRQRIMTGALGVGNRVSEVALARELGISRTPLREAMSELVDHGLLEKLPNGGCVVRGFSRRDILDSIALRGLLEGMAYRRAAEAGAKDADLNACEEIVVEIDTALGATPDQIDLARYIELNEVLHDRMAALCDSDVILRELHRISRLPLASASAFLQGHAMLPEAMQSLFVAQDQHKGILQAIRFREGARAEALAREHARLSGDNLDRILNDTTGVAGRIPGMTLVDRSA